MTVVRGFMLGLVAVPLCGAATRELEPLPLTDANLKAAGKICHIPWIMLAGPKSIRRSGLTHTGYAQDFAKENECLYKQVRIPDDVIMIS